MSKWYNEDVQVLFEAVLILRSQEECKAFFADVCTVKEIIDLSQRLKIAGMLRKKTSYAAITQEIGVSTATISRVSRCLDYGEGGYDLVLNRLKEQGTEKA